MQPERDGRVRCSAWSGVEVIWKRDAIKDVILNVTEPTGKHVGVLSGRRDVDWYDAIERSACSDSLDPSLHLINVAAQCAHPIRRIVAYQKCGWSVTDDNPQSIIYADKTRLYAE